MRDLRFTRPRGGQKSSLPVPKDSRLNAQRKGLGETIAYEVKIPGECHNVRSQVVSPFYIFQMLLFSVTYSSFTE